MFSWLWLLTLDALGQTASGTPWTPLRTSLPAALGKGLRPDGTHPPPFFRAWQGVGPFSQDLPNPLNELSVYTEAVKGAVRLALVRAYKAHPANSVQVTIVPKRGVWAVSAIPAGGITLIPLTPTIGVVAPDASYPQGALPVGILPLPGSTLRRKFYLASIHSPPPVQGPNTRDTTKDIVVPAWNARVVEDGMQANMKVTKVDVQVEGMKISVPAFTTAADVDEGDELLIYVADRKRGLQEAGPLTRTIAFCSHRVLYISSYRRRFRGNRDVIATMAFLAFRSSTILFGFLASPIVSIFRTFHPPRMFSPSSCSLSALRPTSCVFPHLPAHFPHSVPRAALLP